MIIPFALVLMAAIMDLRSFTLYQADLDRELYTVAEVIAGAGSWDATTAEDALRKVMRAGADRLRGCPLQNADACGRSAGWMRVVVIARPRDDPGDPSATPPEPAVPATNSDGDNCNPTSGTAPFCEPEVLFEVDFDTATAGIQRAEWGGDATDNNLCAGSASGMPNEGAQFGRNVVVLPNEAADPDGDGPDPAPQPTEWISRELTSDEWWTVVEVCTHFAGGTSTPGMFGGGMTGFALNAFDVSGSGALPRRVAWGATEVLDDCNWCGATAAGGTP